MHNSETYPHLMDAEESRKRLGGRPPGRMSKNRGFHSKTIIISEDLDDEIERTAGSGRFSVILDGLLRAFVHGEGTLRIPLLGSVAAGPAIWADENVEDYISVDVTSGKEADFVLRVRGNSMSPTVDDGDLVAVRIQKTVQTNDIVVAAFEGEAVVKRFSRRGGLLMLLSDNEDYEALSAVDHEIVGKVVSFFKKATPS